MSASLDLLKVPPHSPPIPDSSSLVVLDEYGLVVAIDPADFPGCSPRQGVVAVAGENDAPVDNPQCPSEDALGNILIRARQALLVFASIVLLSFDEF